MFPESGAAFVMKDGEASDAAPQGQTPDQDYLAELGRQVRRMRALRGMSRKALSGASGISERYIAQLESGQGNASILLLRRIGAAIGVAVEDLLAAADAAPDWPVFRELLQNAGASQRDRARQILVAPERQAGGAPADRIALIGLRGAGKSTLGRIAAERLGWRFVELNREIERASGLSVPEIFNLYGQPGYRRLEQAAVRALIATPEPMVVTTGGGIVAAPLTFELVLASFFTIWLKARPEEHMARVRRQGDLRPMADDRSAMRELRAILLSREPLYARAASVVDTSGQGVDAAAGRLVAAISAGSRPAAAHSPR